MRDVTNLGSGEEHGPGSISRSRGADTDCPAAIHMNSGHAFKDCKLVL